MKKSPSRVLIISIVSFLAGLLEVAQAGDHFLLVEESSRVEQKPAVLVAKKVKKKFRYRDPSTGLIVIEEYESDGSPDTSAPFSGAYLVYGPSATFALPNAATFAVGASGKLGVSTDKGGIEFGLDGGLVSRVGVRLGAYLNLAPIPGEIGKRLYLGGKFYRVYSLNQVEYSGEYYWDESYWLSMVSLGYRLNAGTQKHRRKNKNGKWYIEASLVLPSSTANSYRANSDVRRDDVVYPQLSVGYQF